MARWRIERNDFVKVQRRLKRASFRLEMVQLKRTWAVLSASQQDWGVRDNAEAVGLSATRVHRSFPKEPPFRSMTGKIEARLRPIETITADLDTTTAGNYRLGWLQGFIDQDRAARSEIRRLELGIPLLDGHFE
jgi:hypothetical protein